jgi:FkbM family methyltransferase
MRQKMAVKRTSLRAAIGPEPAVQPVVQDDALARKLDMLTRLMDEQVHLQRVALLEAGHILRFNAAGAQRIVMSLPDAQDDFVQRVILRSRNFYEARLLSMVQAAGVVSPDSVVCDVGANIGNHTVFFGRVLGAAKVLAFEPQEHCHDTLTTNIALNGMEGRAVAYNCMIGARTGAGQMARFNARNLGGTAFAARDGGEIAMFALDDVIEAPDLERLDLIKIDVEGMQLEVLQGARSILEHRRPALWIELLARDNSYDAAADFLAEYGYVPTRLGPNDVLFRA